MQRRPSCTGTVLEMRQQVLGDRHPDTLTSMSNLAAALQGMGQHAEAAELHQHSAGDEAAGAGGQSIRHAHQHEQPGHSTAGHGAACRGGEPCTAGAGDAGSRCWGQSIPTP